MRKQNPTISVLKPGLQTTLQDLGRYSTAAFGVPFSGAMDRQVAQFANQLVMNPIETPVIEMTMMGPKLLFHQDATMAITGANISPTIDGVTISTYQTHLVKEGQVLSFGRLVNGCRAYLAVSGIWKVKKWADSASACTSFPSLLPSSQLKKGDQITIEDKNDNNSLVKMEAPFFKDSIVVKVNKGPDFNRLSRLYIGQFFSTTFTVNMDSNRMGYRLDSSIRLSDNFSMVSSGVLPGTIQVTPSGQPIVLMRDAQTTGGYPRIAVVTSEGINQLSQLKPSDQVRFELIV